MLQHSKRKRQESSVTNPKTALSLNLSGLNNLREKKERKPLSTAKNTVEVLHTSLVYLV